MEIWRGRGKRKGGREGVRENVGGKRYKRGGRKELHAHCTYT